MTPPTPPASTDDARVDVSPEAVERMQELSRRSENPRFPSWREARVDESATCDSCGKRLNHGTYKDWPIVCAECVADECRQHQEEPMTNEIAQSLINQTSSLAAAIISLRDEHPADVHTYLVRAATFRAKAQKLLWEQPAQDDPPQEGEGNTDAEGGESREDWLDRAVHLALILARQGHDDYFIRSSVREFMTEAPR